MKEQFKLELVDLILEKCNCNLAVLQCSGSYVRKKVPIFSDNLFSKRNKIRSKYTLCLWHKYHKKNSHR